MDSVNWDKLKDSFNRAIDLPAEERARFLDGCDAQLKKQINDLIAAHEEAGEFIAEPAMVEIGLADETDSNIGRRIDDYEILEEIGRGGMGAVYLAKHLGESFTQTVAVKLIKRGMDTDSVLKRFVMERQILANLEHPNIARLLDVGTTTDGLPYFVMEYIEGLPVTRFCEAHSFSTEERLKLFREICAAVQYAHQNLVVHRDIKPSNILITKDGTPKLLDFGIAKLLNPDWSTDTAEATATMFRLLTPEYASPEQLRGANITTASDVYSLGVVLYELLSGQRPFRVENDSREEFIQAILTKEPMRPSAVGNNTTNKNGRHTTDDGQENNRKSQIANRKFLKGDLDNIILKALRKEPSRRYASAQEFSEDIRRHLAGLPVTATADTRIYRLNKFVKRHRAGVALGSLIVLIFLSATAVTAWQSVVAKRERDRAEQRFAQVRKLANTVLFEYHDGAARLAGSTPLREKMVTDALEYLDNLSGDAAGDVDLQLEIAAAYEKVGDVQGNPYLANLGNQNGALDSYRKSLTIRNALNSADPTNERIKFELGTSYNKVGDVLWAKGASGEALQNYGQGLELFETLVARDQKNPKYLGGLISSLNGIGQVKKQTGDFKGALETYRRNLTNAETALAIEDSNRTRRGVAVANLKIGDSLAALADDEGALASYQKAVEIFSRESAADKDNASGARELGLCYSRIAGIYVNLERYAESADYHSKALEQQNRLAAADPENVQIQFETAATYQNLGNNFLQMKRLDAATENAERSIKIYTENLAKNPDHTQARGNLGAAYILLAEIVLAKNDWRGALENYNKASAILEDESIRKSQKRTLAGVYEGIAAVHFSQNKPEQTRQAEKMYRKSLEVWRELEEGGKLNDEDAAKLNEITQKIEKCEAALRKS